MIESIIAIAPLLRDIGILTGACTYSVTRVLPLVSDRANKRAIRIIKAKKQS